MGLVKTRRLAAMQKQQRAIFLCPGSSSRPLRVGGQGGGLKTAMNPHFSRFNSPQRIGARGERAVQEWLRYGLPAEYRLMNDVYLPLPDGTTTQIDHIVVSQFGVFVIETKNYSGWIFAGADDSQWTQIFYHKKSRFQNPIHQNYKHICALVENLGIDKAYFHNVVIFNGDCEFKTKMPEGVVSSRRAADYIRSFDRPMIKASQVDELADAIAEWQGTVGEERKANHVANLKKMRSLDK